MADPNVLNRTLNVKIKPAIVLLNSLTEMMKLNSWAVLVVVTGSKRFQIRTAIPNHTACTILEMESEFIHATSDGYSLRFHLQTWLDNLRNLILKEPSSSLSIIKASDSFNLFCLIGNDRQLIRLGAAEFVEAPASGRLNKLPCHVRVTMSSLQFVEFIQSFSDSRHGHNVSTVQLQITRSTIRWITPAGHHNHSAEEYEIEGLQPGDDFQFGMLLDWPLFKMLCSVATSYDSVVISLFQIPGAMNLYWFRFLIGAESYFFIHIEKELLPLQ